MELVSFEILLVALIQFARLQQSCQTSNNHNQANVPFKTSFVAASDYSVRRNGALTSSVLGELPHQAAEEALLLSEAPSFEQTSVDVAAGNAASRRELSWLNKEEIRSLGNQQSASAATEFGHGEQVTMQRAESAKQSVMTYEVDSSPSNQQQNGERPRSSSNEPQRGQDEALADGSYGHSADDLVAAPSGADTGAEQEVLRSRPTEPTGKGVSEQPITTLPPPPASSSSSSSLSTIASTANSVPTTSRALEEPQTRVPTTTSSSSRSFTSASPTTTTTLVTTTKPATPTTTTTASTSTPTSTTTSQLPTTLTSLNLMMKSKEAVSTTSLASSTSEDASTMTTGVSSLSTGANATSDVSLAPTTISTPTALNSTEVNIYSDSTTTRPTTTISYLIASSSTTPASSRSRSGGGDSRRIEATSEPLHTASEVERRLTSKSLEAFASNRSSSARSSHQCEFGQQQSGCTYLVKTVPVVDKWPMSSGGGGSGNSSTALRVVNEFVLVPEDSAVLSSEDSSYPIRKPNANKDELDAVNLRAEHRTVDGETDGAELPSTSDDVELDYLSPDSETLKSLSELVVFGKASPPVATTTTRPPLNLYTNKWIGMPLTTSTSAPENASNLLGRQRDTTTATRQVSSKAPEQFLDSTQISSATSGAGGGKQGHTTAGQSISSTSSSYLSSITSSPVGSSTTTTTRPTTRVSQSFTIRVSPARTDSVNLQRPSNKPTSQPTAGSNRNGELAVSTTSGADTGLSGAATRKPQQAARLNQKILRIGAEQEPPANRLAATTTTTTTTTSTTTTTTTRRPTRLAQSGEQRQKSSRIVSGRHRQFFSEPIGDLRRRSPMSDTYSPLANGADEEEASILNRYTIPSQLTRISSIKKTAQVNGLARIGATAESAPSRRPTPTVSRKPAQAEAEPVIGRRIQLAADQKVAEAANEYRQNQKQSSSSRESLSASQAVRQNVASPQTVLDESRLAGGQPKQLSSLVGVTQEPYSGNRQSQQVAANISAALQPDWVRSLAVERELERAPVARASSGPTGQQQQQQQQQQQPQQQASGRQATVARFETRSTTSGELQTTGSNLINNLATEQRFLANSSRQTQSNSTSRKTLDDGLSSANVAKLLVIGGAATRQPLTTTIAAAAMTTTTTTIPTKSTTIRPLTTTTLARDSDFSVELINSTTTIDQRKSTDRNHTSLAIKPAQRKEDVMTLIASSSNVSHIGAQSTLSSLIEPVEANTANVQRADERKAASETTTEPDLRAVPERHSKAAAATGSSSPAPARQRFTAANKLPEIRTQRGGLSSSADEYEGSVEDQLAKDALHNRPRSATTAAAAAAAAAPKRTNAYTGARQSPLQVQPAMDSGKWSPSGDELAISLSASADNELANEAQTAANLLPGRPGVDYPIHWQVPKTSFDCRNYEQSGFYADVESDCQAYHSCHKWRGGRHTFLCPNGTLFSQELLTCDWWYNVECSASKLYLANEGANGGPYEKSVGDLAASRRTPNELSSRRGAA